MKNYTVKLFLMRLVETPSARIEFLIKIFLDSFIKWQLKQENCNLHKTMIVRCIRKAPIVIKYCIYIKLSISPFPDQLTNI